MICKQGTCHGRNWNSETQQTLWIVKTVDVKFNRKWQSLKKWIPKELSNKQKFTRDVNESIRDYVFAFVCRTNWGNASTLKNLAGLASKCWVPKKKRVWNACNTIWWWYPIELRINGLRVAQIPSKRPNQFFYTNQKCCKGSEFHGCLGLQTSKISGTVVPTWPCFYMRAGVLFGEDRIFAGAGGVVGLDASSFTSLGCSRWVISDISISLDFVGCRVWENIHPWILEPKVRRGAKSIFSVKRINRCPTGECLDDCNEHVMYGLCRLYWLGGWCPTGPLHVSGQHQLWAGVLKMAMKRFWRWAEYDIEMSSNFSAHKLRFLGEELRNCVTWISQNNCEDSGL